jgi:hypothetical protein
MATRLGHHVRYERNPNFLVLINSSAKKSLELKVGGDTAVVRWPQPESGWRRLVGDGGAQKKLVPQRTIVGSRGIFSVVCIRS